TPRLVEAEAESVRMYFLTQCRPLRLTKFTNPSGRGFRPRRRLLRARLRRRSAFATDFRDLQRSLAHLYREVGGPLHDAVGTTHRGRAHALHRWPLVGVARRDVK